VDGKEETPFCPTCGQPTTYRLSPEWLMGHWSGRYVGIIAALLESRRMRRGLSLEEIINAAYANVLTPMPSDPVGNVRVLMTINKDKMQALGWRIVGPHTTGNGFWLVPIEGE